MGNFALVIDILQGCEGIVEVAALLLEIIKVDAAVIFVILLVVFVGVIPKGKYNVNLSVQVLVFNADAFIAGIIYTLSYCAFMIFVACLRISTISTSGSDAV